MSKYANAGELRTKVIFKEINRSTNERAVSVEAERSVFANDAALWCKWVNAHGSEAFTAMQMKLREPATLTCRYSPLIKPQNIVYRVGDPDPYEIISINNVLNENEWLEIKVQRKAAAR